MTEELRSVAIRLRDALTTIEANALFETFDEDKREAVNSVVDDLVGFIQSGTPVRKVKICQDKDPQHPRRDMDPFGTLVCWHSRYNLGDDEKDPSCSPGEYLDELYGITDQIAEAEEDFTEKHFDDYTAETRDDFYKALDQHLSTIRKAAGDASKMVRLPVFLFDHSGLALSTGDFGDPWDSGQVGWIYATEDEMKVTYEVDEITDEVQERAKKALEACIEEYSLYLQNNVFGYELYEDDEVVDSCWGFICEPGKWQESGIAEHLPDEFKDPSTWEFEEEWMS